MAAIDYGTARWRGEGVKRRSHRASCRAEPACPDERGGSPADRANQQCVPRLRSGLDASAMIRFAPRWRARPRTAKNGRLSDHWCRSATKARVDLQAVERQLRQVQQHEKPVRKSSDASRCRRARRTQSISRGRSSYSAASGCSPSARGSGRGSSRAQDKRRSDAGDKPRGEMSLPDKFT